MTADNIPTKRFHTQLTLPRKPSVPREAATKGYVDDLLAYELASKADADMIGAANGIAPLDASGKVADVYLPPHVDVVLEFASLAVFPTTGEKGKIYLALNTGKIYRWSGSTYVVVNDSVTTADKANTLVTARNFSLTGVITAAAVSFNGSGNVVLSTSIADDALSIAKVSGLQMALDGKAFSTHTHALANLAGTLSIAKGGTGATTAGAALIALGAAAATHSHGVADVTGLQDALDGKATSTHTHSAADITSGTLPIARGGTGATTAAAARTALGLGTMALEVAANYTKTASLNTAIDGLTIKSQGIGSVVDLNMLTTSGVYVQPTNANATLELNYPVAAAGWLEVLARTGGQYIIQRYTHYSTGVVYSRSYYNGTWSAWRQLLDSVGDVLINGLAEASGTTAVLNRVNRTSSTTNALYEAKTTNGSVYFGQGRAGRFAVGTSNDLATDWLFEVDGNGIRAKSILDAQGGIITNTLTASGAVVVNNNSVRVSGWGGTATDGVVYFGSGDSYIYKIGSNFNFNNASGGWQAVLSSGGTILTNTNAVDLHNHSQVYIDDTRGAVRAPNFYPGRMLSMDFQNRDDTGAGDNYWHALLTVHPWDTFSAGNHIQQQIAFTGANLKWRGAASDTTWNGWRTVWDSGNFDPNAKANVNSPAFTGAPQFPSYGGSFVIRSGAGDNATLTHHNTVFRGWWGFGFADYTGTSRIVFDLRAGNILASDFSLTSDERLKTGIVDLPFNGQLRPVLYERIETGNMEYGFIAQDLQEQYPHAVKESGEYLTVQYQRLIPVLSKQLNLVEERAAALERENAELHARLERLEAVVARLSQ